MKALGLSLWMLSAIAVAEPAAPSPSGAHDFDFNFGVWHTDIQRAKDPFAANPQTIHMQGTVTVRKIWDGRGEYEEIEAEGPNGHWEGLTLFLFNPSANQWSQIFVNGRDGRPVAPLVGLFKNGRGELFEQDTYNGRSIFVRGVWSDITPNGHRYEESYSDDGGKTWHVAFSAKLNRDKQTAPEPTVARDPKREGGHEFDFDFGRWKTHSSRLVKPLSGSQQWAEMDGVTTVRPIWGGRANIAELESDGPKGHLELMAMRFYEAGAHQWNLNFAMSPVGVLNVNSDGVQGLPMVGEYKDGKASSANRSRTTAARSGSGSR